MAHKYTLAEDMASSDCCTQVKAENPERLQSESKRFFKYFKLGKVKAQNPESLQSKSKSFVKFKFGKVKAEDPEVEARFLRLQEEVKAKNPELAKLSNEELNIIYSKLQQKFNKEREKLEDLQSRFIKRLDEPVKDLCSMADELDKFHKASTIASMTGSSIGIAGGITTIVGLCLAPVTFGASLIVTDVGIGVATAGGVTGAVASIADEVNIKKIYNKVGEIMKKVHEEIEEIQDLFLTIEITCHEMNNIECLLNTKRDDPNGGKKHTGGIGAPSDPILLRTLASFSVIIVRLLQLAVQLVQIAVRGASLAARGALIAARGGHAAFAFTGVLTAGLMLLDIGVLTRDAMDIKKGAKSEVAKQIRAITEELKEFCEHLKLIGNAILQTD